MRTAAAFCLTVLVLGACGGSSDEADAGPPDAQTFDAPPVEQLSVTLNSAAVCPEGWTTGPTATDDEVGDRITIRGSCSTDLEEVLMHFAPRPAAPGGTADCYQTTFQINGGNRVNCRVNNAVLNPPSGQLTLSTSTPARVAGSCDCSGDDDGTAVSASATFDLTLN